MASDAAGNFVVVWRAGARTGTATGIFAQRYDASGAPRGGEFQVNTYTTDYQGRRPWPRTRPGNFVVVWTSAGRTGAATASSPSATTPRARLGAASSRSTPTRPTISTHRRGLGRRRQLRRGWSSSVRTRRGGVFAQRYDASGAPRGGEFRVNTYTTGGQCEPAVASDAAGNFVVAWTSYGPGRKRLGRLRPALRRLGRAARRRVPGQHLHDRRTSTSRPWPRTPRATSSWPGRATGRTGALRRRLRPALRRLGRAAGLRVPGQQLHDELPVRGRRGLGRRRQLRRGLGELWPGRERRWASSPSASAGSSPRRSRSTPAGNGVLEANETVDVRRPGRT